MKIILASKSPRREDLLNKTGLKFEIVDSKLDESLIPTTEPKKYCQTIL